MNETCMYLSTVDDDEENNDNAFGIDCKYHVFISELQVLFYLFKI